MTPTVRRRIAAGHLVASLAVGFPLSWWLPTIGPPWFDRVLLAISFYAITITALDVLATTDVRTQQDSD
jgi:hypothetical protein